MEQECKCGAVLELEPHEVSSEMYHCPQCGKSRRLKYSGHPKPVIAVLLSIVCPGVGHLYAGGYALAISAMCSGILLSNLIMAAFVYWKAAPFNIMLPMLTGAVFTASVFWTAAAKAREFHRLEKKPPRPGSVRTYIVFAVLFWVAESSLVPMYGNFRIYINRTGSMEPSVMVDERLLVDLSAYEDARPNRGDVIVFKFPPNPQITYVKRCVAIGGDTVQMVSKELYVNGRKEAPSSQVVHRDSAIVEARDSFDPVVVAPGNYFMLGDNRDNSYDSRFWGTVGRGMIIGRVEKLFYSPHLARWGLSVH